MTKNPASRRDPQVGLTLRAAAHAALDRARAPLSDAALPASAVIFELRKALKRWRALLRLLEPAIGDDGRRLRRQARDLSRALGGSRDAQSALDALTDLAAGPSSQALSTRTIATIRQRLERARAALEQEQLSRAQRNLLVAALDAASDAVDEWPLDRLNADELESALTRSYRRSHRLIPDNWNDAPSDELHDLRRRVVELRYQFGFVEPLLPRLSSRVIAHLQPLRGALGRHQDLTLLVALAAPRRPLARWRSTLLPLIASRQAEHAAAAEKAAKRALARSPKAFRKMLETYRKDG